MELIWQVGDEDIQQVRSLIAQYDAHPLLRWRREHNLAAAKPAISHAEFWWTLISCLVTTQQRSGPQSAVARFVNQEPFPLAYDQCRQMDDIASYAEQTLADAGLRRYRIMAREIAYNWSFLMDGHWEDVENTLGDLAERQTLEAEREAAGYFAWNFKGVGPKQARNLLQMLGLTRYEIPLDSRIIKWLNGIGFPVYLSASALMNIDYYLFVEDGVRALCEASGVYPCILDAAIFVSYDGDGWTEDNIF
ncbi:MAG: hypothetical protein JXN59_08330 [Anaerolineae bacterium]|nr:hypothetical protein [Anaerolineae bacterium]